MIIFAADIGGTTARFAIVDTTKKKILLRTEKENKEINLVKEIEAFLDTAAEQGWKPREGHLSVAGPITLTKERRRIVQNNGQLIVDEKQLEKKTRLSNVTVLNDFEALGYAIPHIKSRTLQRGKKAVAPAVIIGPGTGLGQAIAIPEKKGVRVLLSEGHHTDIPLLTPEEFALGVFTNAEEHRPEHAPVWHEDLLSGRGLERLYRFYRLTLFLKEQILPTRMTAAEIGESRKKNPCSKKAFEQFSLLLARRCRNFALEVKALGGVYLAGGVVQKNTDAFGKAFVTEFITHHHPQWKTMLEEMPIRIITNKDACLLGAALAKRR